MGPLSQKDLGGDRGCLIRDRKCLLSQQGRDTMESFVRNHHFFLFFFFYEAVKYEQGVSAAEKHVLVLIFLSCVIALSKCINHERVTSRNDEDL